MGATLVGRSDRVEFSGSAARRHRYEERGLPHRYEERGLPRRRLHCRRGVRHLRAHHPSAAARASHALSLEAAALESPALPPGGASSFSPATTSKRAFADLPSGRQLRQRREQRLQCTRVRTRLLESARFESALEHVPWYTCTTRVRTRVLASPSTRVVHVLVWCTSQTHRRGARSKKKGKTAHRSRLAFGSGNRSPFRRSCFLSYLAPLLIVHRKSGATRRYHSQASRGNPQALHASTYDVHDMPDTNTTQHGLTLSIP
jgi:hypothetical protein